MIASLFDRFIHLYQRTFSPDHGIFSGYFPYGYCRFTPTCSQYAREALKRYGAIKGLILATKRILRCNPFTANRHDPVV
ncbi:MAG: membrane protein insertion efficiency factor YidD [bacterium]|nr:membrane protein insertion efficiency factor YidD [bacterium]